MSRKRGEGGLAPVGDILIKSPALKVATSLTPHVMKLLDAATTIRN